MLSHLLPPPQGESNCLILYPLSLTLSRRERGRFIRITAIVVV